MAKSHKAEARESPLMNVCMYVYPFTQDLHEFYL